METYFKINFADPGSSLVTDKKKRFKGILNQGVGVSLSLLIIFLILMTSGGSFYVFAVYLPQEKSLKEKKNNLKRMESQYKTKAAIRQERLDKANGVLKVINELDKTKGNAFTWSDRMRALNRSLVKNLWLSSLQVRPQAPAKSSVKPGKGKQVVHKKKADIFPKKFRVTIRGATYANPAKKPLKKISRFMANLVDEPYWGEYFALKDWSINSTKALINFEVVLESKSL